LAADVLKIETKMAQSNELARSIDKSWYFLKQVYVKISPSIINFNVQFDVVLLCFKRLIFFCNP